MAIDHRILQQIGTRSNKPVLDIFNSIIQDQKDAPFREQAIQQGQIKTDLLQQQADVASDPNTVAANRIDTLNKITNDYATGLNAALSTNNPEQVKQFIQSKIQSYSAQGIDNDILQSIQGDIAQVDTPTGMQELLAEANSALGVSPAQPKVGTFRFIETPTGIASLNTVTGEQTEKALTSKELELARKQTLDQTKEELKSTDTTFDRAKKIRDRHDKLSGEFVKVRDAFDRVRASEQTAAGDIALIFNYMKMLDPGSVVREGEFATAQNAGGVDDRVLNTYNKLMTGERLNPKQRISFESQAGKLFDKAEGRNKSLIKETTSIGEQFGVTADNIFGSQVQPAQTSFTEGQTATGANGEKIIFTNGQWVAQ